MANVVGRNDVAIEKAQNLAKEHNIKTSAYKVDGERHYLVAI